MENSKIYESDEKPKNIINMDLQKIYLKILGRDFVSYKFNKIILGTKKLVSNNLNYNDFSKEYDDITKIASFKYPGISIFPISKNSELISLGKIRYLYDSTKKRVQSSVLNSNNKGIKQNHNLFLKSNSLKSNSKYISKIKINSTNIKEKNTYDKIELDYKSKSSKKLMNYKLLRSPFHKDSNINLKRNKNLLSNDNYLFRPASNYCKKNKRIYSCSNGNTLNGQHKTKKFLIKNSFINMLKYQKYIYKNRILLRDTLLNEKNYLDLEYNEAKIFMKIDHYNNFLRNKINDIKLNKLKFHYPYRFEKIYEKSKLNNPKLVLKPIIVEFIKINSFQNKSLNNQEQNQIFEIPFEYTPIFYINNFSKLSEILSCIFFLNEDFSKFDSNYDNFSYLLRFSSGFTDSINSSKDLIQKSINKKTLTTKINSFQSLSLNKSTSSKVAKRISVSHLKECIKIIDIFGNEYSFNSANNSYESKFLKRFSIIPNDDNYKQKKLYFVNKNSYEYIWLTPKGEYLVNIKTPEITFYINDFIINKTIDIELLFYLIENNFENWDFYTIEYLFSFLKFSLIINNFLSLYKISKYDLKDNFSLKDKIINLSEEKKFKYSKKNNKFEYIFTDKNKINYIKVFHYYKLLVFNKRINKNYQFCFHMNSIQMNSFYFSAKKQGIKNLVEKLILLDKGNSKIKLNYDYLDNFGKDDFNNLEDLIQTNSNNSKETEKENKYNFNLNDSKLCLFYPYIESIKFKNNLITNRQGECFESNSIPEVKERLEIKILEKILKTDNLFQWPNIIEMMNIKMKQNNNK